MEELLAYGQSLGFGFTFITQSGSGVTFSRDENSRAFALYRNASSSMLRIQYAENVDAGTWSVTGSVSTMSEAKTAILNFYNSQ
jgi:hypothetical protein